MSILCYKLNSLFVAKEATSYAGIFDMSLNTVIIIFDVVYASNTALSVISRTCAGTFFRENDNLCFISDAQSKSKTCCRFYKE